MDDVSKRSINDAFAKNPEIPSPFGGGGLRGGEKWVFANPSLFTA
jgi:hypothetical protein